MSLSLRCCMAALPFAWLMSAHAAEPDTYQVQAATPLAAVPVHIVAINDRLRAQIAYDYAQMQGVSQQAQMNAMNMPGVDPLTGALGGAIGAAIANAAIREAAENDVEAAYATLLSRQCDLPMHEAYQASLARSVQQSPWGSSAPVHPHLLGPKDSIDGVVGKKGSRYVLSFAYSLTPDFSSVVTAVSALAYSDALPGAPKRWETKPAWTNVVYVVSDRLPLAAKTADDVTLAVASETERFQASPAPALIARANAGDTQARSKAAKLVREHERLMRDAKQDSWTPSQEAAARARLWVENDCARMKDVLQANVQDVETAMAQLFRGELPVPAADARPGSPLEPLAGEVDGERRVLPLGPGTHVARRGGDRVPLNYVRSWLAVPKDK